MAKKHIATINATHAGFINGNNTFYVEEDMANAVATWIDPYQKPVLTHHEIKKDAVGRVLSAKYIQMHSDGKNTPKGYIQLEAEINDQDTVNKIKDKRFNTVSISTDAKKAVCSICERDIAKDGLCKHERGKKYDGEKCFWYLGGLKYKEVSYVNAPADEYANTEKLEEKEIMETMTDAVKKPKFTFADSTEQTEDKDECEKWENYTEDDLALAYWLMVEIDSELSTEDKTISTKSRKAMKTSTFCGPNRSFPVPDCAHVTAARRLIGKYKGPGDKTKILACVSRKAKAMGCGTSKDNLIEGASMAITLKDALECSEVKQHIDSEILKATKPLNDQLAGMSALTDKANKLEKEAVAKDEEITAQKANVKKLEDSVTALKAEMHKTLVDRVFDLRKNLQKKDVMALKDEKEAEAFKAELAKRTDESLKDAVADLSKEVEPKTVKTDKPLTSTADGTETEDASKQKPAPAAAPGKTRVETVKNIIFKD